MDEKSLLIINDVLFIAKWFLKQDTENLVNFLE